MASIKGRCPWRIGATSFVIPADIEENVRYLADKVDDVQLLFFESAGQSRMPQQVDVSWLREVAACHNLSYTVHLPTDIQPGSGSEVDRQRAVAEIVHFMDVLSPIEPLRYDLHLAWPQGLILPAWLENIAHFLDALKKNIGQESGRVAIENIDYPFHHVRSLILQHGFDLCLDIGHAVRFNDDVEQVLNDIPGTTHIHYHGVKEGRDHQPLGMEQGPLTARLGELFRAGDFHGVVTLEVYSSHDLQASLQHIDGIWTRSAQEKK
ncbi:MAG: sugar phosphate isomerase/epimerase [Deltaproteobacteria bacterium]|nr:sugar phosphate isomerase/epimerase [Deltaproteobacteria bacterium]